MILTPHYQIGKLSCLHMCHNLIFPNLGKAFLYLFSASSWQYTIPSLMGTVYY